MISAVAGQVAVRDREGMCHTTARWRHGDLLVLHKLLAGGRSEEFDELQVAAGIAVNLANVPQMKSCLGGRCHYRCSADRDSAKDEACSWM